MQIKSLFTFLLMLVLAGTFAREPKLFKNPIIPGFHPDPSICRVGEDYYLVNSSFEWFPGIPIFQSKDLVNWQQIGHVLDRPSQLLLKEGLAPSNGIWAPTIRYIDGTYYVIVTGMECGGNFYVTAKNPNGPWSDPVYVDAPGIDPEIFRDEDGKTYFVWSSQGKIPPARRWQWEDRIFIQEIDLKNGTLLGERTYLTSGHASNARWCEGPHIYRINDKYLLLTAEGGTWEQHAVTAFVADKVTGPYEPLHTNPVLTHRHWGNKIDITTIGHADLVQTQFGDWYAVMLGVRPKNGFRNLGRETFLTSVEFQGITPVFNPGISRVLMQDLRPKLPWSPVAIVPARDEFKDSKLRYCWSFLRTPTEKWWKTDTVKGGVTLWLRPQTTTQLQNPSYIARRQQHHTMEVKSAITFKPKKENEVAGLVVMQNDKFQYQLLKVREGKQHFVKLIKVAATNRKDPALVNEVARVEWKDDNVILGIKARNMDYTFYYGSTEENMQPLGETQDGTILSSNVAGGFIGAFVGMYASSNGVESKNTAQFKWFEYNGLD